MVSECVRFLSCDLVYGTNGTCSLDEKKAQVVVDEIKSAGGDALAVGGDVSADDFPEKVVNATIQYVLRFLDRSCGSCGPEGSKLEPGC